MKNLLLMFLSVCPFEIKSRETDMKNLLLMFLSVCPFGLPTVQSCTTYTISTSSSVGQVISSPNFPSDYPNSAFECWIFTVSSGTIELYIKEFDTEATYDYLRIYDGTSDSGWVIASLSGSLHSNSYHYSYGSYMYVEFVSDLSNTRDGFQACACSVGQSCSCSDFVNIPDSWGTWGWSAWNSWDSSSPAGTLTAAAIAGIVVGVLLCVAIPIIIGVSIACCHTTDSRNTYANRRAARNAVVAGSTNAAATPYPNNPNPNHNDRKHNQVRPAAPGGPQPPNYNAMNQPPPPYYGGAPPGSYPAQGGVIMNPNAVPGAGGSNVIPPPAHHPVDAAYPPPPAMYPPPPPAEYTAAPQAAGPGAITNNAAANMSKPAEITPTDSANTANAAN